MHWVKHPAPSFSQLAFSPTYLPASLSVNKGVQEKDDWDDWSKGRSEAGTTAERDDCLIRIRDDCWKERLFKGTIGARDDQWQARLCKGTIGVRDD